VELIGSPIFFEREELIFACPPCGISMPDIAYVARGARRRVSTVKA
jgi:hypothetical protein